MDAKLEGAREGDAGDVAEAVAVLPQEANTVSGGLDDGLSQPQAVPLAREVGSERALALVLRAGAVLGGASFLLSLLLELLPPHQYVHVGIDLLRKAGASFLIVTPVARLGVAGVLLGLRGEWRYLLYATVSIGLLAAAFGVGFAA